jgi:hypothetical protein
MRWGRGGGEDGARGGGGRCNRPAVHERRKFKGAKIVISFLKFV